MTPELNWLTDPTVFAVNRLDAHSDHVYYKTEAEAETGLTSLRQSLDGAWRFVWSANPAARPADFYKPDADLTAFGTIRVPGHIELQGYGQIQYTNTLYPWDGRAALRPPQINWDDDPVGSYVKEFDLDESLRGQRVCVSFQGVEQAMYLWCNGRFVGYAEDTVEPQAALRVDAVYHGVPGAPELPCFGVKFQTFAPVARAQWTGLSGETYPDRYKGGVFGCHEEVPHIAPALVPQDCGLHMDTQQVVLQLADGSELTLEQTGEPFAFSALPNTAQEIEAAQHISELPNTGRTSITVLGAVRGVGGIDSWGTDVEKPYHIPGDRDHSVSFRIVF